MPRRFQISIDLPRLRENLSRQEGHLLSDSDVFRWLAEAGFRRVDDQWLVTEPDLGQLEPDEVVSAVVLGESEVGEDEDTCIP